MSSQTFITGTTYNTRSICDHGCVFSLTVVSRTEKTVTWNNGKRCKVRIHDGVETCLPMGSYSMAPMFRSDRAA